MNCYRNDRHHVYNIWTGVKRRCYDSKCKSYKNYGAKGVTMCDEWLIFDNFYKDYFNIEGFDRKLFDEGKLFLDKDLKVRGNKLYSFETCILTTNEVNIKYRPNVNYKVVGISPTGEEFIFENQFDFSIEHGLDYRNVNACIQGSRDFHLGWQFYKYGENYIVKECPRLVRGKYKVNACMKVDSNIKHEMKTPKELEQLTGVDHRVIGSIIKGKRVNKTDWNFDIILL